jgi:hypothetical protein
VAGGRRPVDEATGASHGGRCDDRGPSSARRWACSSTASRAPPQSVVCSGWRCSCSVAGALVGLFTRLGTFPAWNLSLIPTPGCASVVVSSSDPRVLARAEKVLRESGPPASCNSTSTLGPWARERALRGRGMCWRRHRTTMQKAL